MIKLTSCFYIADEGGLIPARPIWVAPSHIQTIEALEVAKGVFLTEVATANRIRTVLETPEQIMAMPEMMYAMYPAMVANVGEPAVWGGPFTARST